MVHYITLCNCPCIYMRRRRRWYRRGKKDEKEEAEEEEMERDTHTPC